MPAANTAVMNINLISNFIFLSLFYFHSARFHHNTIWDPAGASISTFLPGAGKLHLLYTRRAWVCFLFRIRAWSHLYHGNSDTKPGRLCNPAGSPNDILQFFLIIFLHGGLANATFLLLHTNYGLFWPRRRCFSNEDQDVDCIANVSNQVCGFCTINGPHVKYIHIWTSQLDKKVAPNKAAS